MGVQCISYFCATSITLAVTEMTMYCVLYIEFAAFHFTCRATAHPSILPLVFQASHLNSDLFFTEDPHNNLPYKWCHGT